MKIHNLDIPKDAESLYKSRLEKIKKKGLFFEFSDKNKRYPNCDSYSFGRVLYVRKFKEYAIVIFFTKGTKETFILKDHIKKSFLENVRNNDYIYTVGERKDNGDIDLVFFRIVTISLTIDSKKKDFLHQRLIGNQEGLSMLHKYSELYSVVDKFFKENGYIEFRGRILQDSFYGGTSRPFITYSNNSHKDKYLRLSAETFLKATLTGGIENIYEFGTVFRNEADSNIRGEEFRVLEFCSANQNLKDFRNFLLEFIKKTLGYINIQLSDYNEICKVENSLLGFAEFKSTIVPNIIEPTVVYNLPSGTSPFIASKREDDSIAERELLIINGMTIAEIYQNERNPFKQLAFLNKQFSESRDYNVDYTSYLHSQFIGGPIINVCFMSVDRLLFLITDQDDIRQLF